MQSNKFSYFLFFAIAILTSALLPVCHKFDDLDNTNLTDISSTRKLVMLDGLKDPMMVDFYKEDIQFVYEHTDSKYIKIYCFNVDLNSDGFEDKVVVLQSPVHSCSSGDPLHILLYNKEGNLDNVFSCHLQLFSQMPPSSLTETEFFLTDEMPHGFYGLLVKYCGEIILELKHNGKAYEVEFYAGRKNFEVAMHLVPRAANYQ